MLNILTEMMYHDDTLKAILYLMLFILITYGLVFFYLINTYVKVNGSFISKKIIDKVRYINGVIDTLVEDKTFLDNINTSITTVINYSSNKYGKLELVTISLDKTNNVISIITSSRNYNYVLNGYVTNSEIMYVENELLKRIHTRK